MSDLNKNFVIKNGLEVGLGGTILKTDTSGSKSDIFLGNVGLGSTGGTVTVYGNLNVLGVTTVTVQGSVDAARTAEKLLNARNISLSGVTTGSVSFDGSQNVTISQTLQPDSVGLGTHTSGEYVKNLTAGSGVSISSGTGEGSSPTITNSDRGSSQVIFKKIGIQTTSSATGIGTTISATSNDDEVQFIAGSNVTLTPDFANKKITIGSTYIDTNTTYTIGVTDSSGDKLITLTPNSGAGTTVTLSAGSNVALNIVAGKLVISSTDTNTTYSVGVGTSGVRLSGSDGSVGIVTFSGSNGVGIVTSSTGITVSIANTIGVATIGYSTVTASNIGVATIGRLSVTGLTTSTHLQITGFTTTVNQSITGIATIGRLAVTGLTTSLHLNVTGVTTTVNQNITGVATVNTLNVTGLTTTNNLNVIGVSTLGVTTFTGSVGFGSTVVFHGNVGVGSTAVFTFDVDGIINTSTDFYRRGSSLTSQLIGLIVALS